MDERPWFVYMLLCKNGRIYTGATPNIAERFKRHSAGKGAIFTRINPPEQILATKVYPDKRSALQAEYQIKKLSRQQKHHLAKMWLEQNSIHHTCEESPSVE